MICTAYLRRKVVLLFVFLRWGFRGGLALSALSAIVGGAEGGGALNLCDIFR